MAGADYTIEVISNHAALSDLEIDWNRLSDAAKAPNVFTTFGWFEPGASAFRATSRPSQFRPHVIVLKKNEAVAGLSP